MGIVYTVKQGQEIRSGVLVGIAKLIFQESKRVAVTSSYRLGKGVATEKSTFDEPLSFLQYGKEQQRNKIIRFHVAEVC